MDDDQLQDQVPDHEPPPEDQNPPEGYEPQVELTPGQHPGIQERPSDLVTDAEPEEASADPKKGDADDGDDEAVDSSIR